MVASNSQQLHHRAVRDGSADSVKPSVLPRTTISPPPSNQKPRRRINMLNGILSTSTGNGGLFSKQSILLLFFGTLLGYVVLPIIVVHTNSLISLGSIESKISSNGGDDQIRNLSNADLSGVMMRLIENKNLLATQSMPTHRSPTIMETVVLSDHRRKKILVTGGAGFVGSHLVDKLMMEGHEVTVVDNFFTGQKKNVAHWMHHPNFRYAEGLFI